MTAVEFALSRTPALKLEYAGIAEELQAMGIDGSPRASQVANGGDPHPPTQPARRCWQMPAALFQEPDRAGRAGGGIARRTRLDAGVPRRRRGSRKPSAAWLIDQCGWKGPSRRRCGVSAAHALVLVNHGHASGAQLLGLARRIAASVQERLAVAIEPEPRIIGASW